MWGRNDRDASYQDQNHFDGYKERRGRGRGRGRGNLRGRGDTRRRNYEEDDIDWDNTRSSRGTRNSNWQPWIEGSTDGENRLGPWPSSDSASMGLENGQWSNSLGTPSEDGGRNFKNEGREFGELGPVGSVIMNNFGNDNNSDNNQLIYQLINTLNQNNVPNGILDLLNFSMGPKDTGDQNKKKYLTSVPLEKLSDVELNQRHIHIIEFETILSLGSLHIPVEMAAYSFSLEKGEIASFHKFVDPGNIPLWFVHDYVPLLLFFFLWPQLPLDIHYLQIFSNSNLFLSFLLLKKKNQSPWSCAVQKRPTWTCSREV
eukprot:TRINITY_DN5111_c0_g4_i7.p1 TRINITY_DN5111_c0_g4~~TRINITY_DN5111_c0_g4_i7.p1  ORF type:complete len:315 (+),score=52.64 TRINITY_DN5111_c0_g4_i7:57-1001(+)